MSFLEKCVREGLSNPKTAGDVREAMGWDAPSASRFLSGNLGVTIDKLDAILKSVGFVAVSTTYLEAISTLCKVGAHCECARQGAGECGRGAA